MRSFVQIWNSSLRGFQQWLLLLCLVFWLYFSILHTVLKLWGRAAVWLLVRNSNRNGLQIYLPAFPLYPPCPHLKIVRIILRGNSAYTVLVWNLLVNLYLSLVSTHVHWTRWNRKAVFYNWGIHTLKFSTVLGRIIQISFIFNFRMESETQRGKETYPMMHS